MYQHSYKCDVDRIATGRIYVGLGANSAHHSFGKPGQTLQTALRLLQERQVFEVLGQSGWFLTTPIPASRQSWFVNGAVEVRTTLGPGELLAALHRIEADLGRRRGIRNAPRTIDLDLLDFQGRIVRPQIPGGLELPHPRCAERRFVLYPLRDIAPRWRHPIVKRSIADLIHDLGKNQYAIRMHI